MRRWIIGAFYAGLALAGGYATAQIVPALPFQLQNNTLADATQVMANFNQILNNVNTNAAKSGANSDITSLLGLTTPIAPSVGGTSTWTGGTSTGTANAQVVASVVPVTYSLAVGTRAVFIAGNTNTSSLTLNVAGSGVKNVFRHTQIGPIGMVGGEVRSGAIIEVVYDGTQYQMLGPQVLVGAIQAYGGTTAPLGWVFADGSCVPGGVLTSGLATVFGGTWGSCTPGDVPLPDLRGRAPFGDDNMGGTTASRITNAGSGCVGTTLAVGCGAQNHTIAQANLPNVNFTLAITDNRTWSVTALGPGAVGGPVAGAVTTAAPGALTVTPAGAAPSGTAASGGSGTALAQLPPLQIVNYIIKY